ncbi:hypothetical protein HNQ07_000955 [Deinococcus metalli]|uniref:Uncharacterized protein n=1 Tax=Deinococcus metalli TaxID=1141878 RepID=A0A7W8KEG0_9DEIO|nr:hypothetical protein [Deinococcus metalli]MBB5375511.1 hypothetical protein [Deinococcus metalli]GHF28719.1 hypothetical protein GCM10017781_00850 [Deinococcus metalli]
MRDFAPGQRWTYATRPGEESSTILILATEPGDDGGIVHIRVEGLHLHTPHGEQGELAHSPISDAALRHSVTALVEENAALPDDHAGLRHWADAYSRGEAGYFTLSVAEIVAAIEEVVGGAAGSDAPPLFRKANPK